MDSSLNLGEERKLKTKGIGFSDYETVNPQSLIKSVISLPKELDGIISRSILSGILSGQFGQADEKPKIASDPLVFPPFYIGYLNEMQDIMTQDGALSMKHGLETNEDVIAFLDKFFDYLISKSVVPAAERNAWHDGIRLALRLLRDEAAQQDKTSSFNFRNKKIADAGDQLKSQLVALVQTAYSSFISIKNARAQSECYREGQGGGGGSNLPAPCCNCYAGKTPIGCLNKVCPSGPAIWDPQTKICGCGSR